MNSPNGFPPDFDASDVEIIRAVEPYTMTSTERIHALIQAVRHIVRNRIPGDMVECGVWKGGSVMAMALTLLQLGDHDRSLYLFDTFSGMTTPTDRDVDFEGQQAQTILDEVRCEASQQDVENAVFSTGYDREKIHFVGGRVEETIPAHAPELIALLRLDTDWYESTQHELLHLFPRLARGGVIIIDDYGHWRGARQAVDEYIAQNQIPLLLNRIDYTGRIGVKI
jgi:predicted O-methyltransferase YrrM